MSFYRFVTNYVVIFMSSTGSNYDKFYIIKLKAHGCNVLKHHIRCIDDAHVRYRLV